MTMIKIDGEEYEFGQLSNESKAQLATIRYTECPTSSKVGGTSDCTYRLWSRSKESSKEVLHKTMM